MSKIENPEITVREWKIRFACQRVNAGYRIALEVELMFLSVSLQWFEFRVNTRYDKNTYACNCLYCQCGF